VPYFGNEPAKSAIKVGDNTILSSSIADGVIINADIKSDAAIAMSKTALSAGTGITLATNTLNVDAAQTQITSVGTIGTGVWNGTAIASAYLDADTAHLSGTQTFSGAKTFSSKILVETGNVGSAHADWDTLTLEENGRCGLTIISPNDNFGAIDFADGDGNEQGMIQYKHATNQMFIKTAGTPAITLDSSQNATFAGTITGSYSNSSGTDYLDGDAGLYLANSGSDGTMIKFGDTNAGLVYGGSGTGTFKIMQRENTALSFDASRNATFAGSILKTGDLTVDVSGDIILDADDEHIFLKDGGTTIGNIDLGSQNITIRNSVSNADLIFRGNDGGTEVEAMRINYSGNNVGIGTSSIGAKLHVADNRSTAYDGTAEPAETMIIHNKNGSDGSGVNNYASLSWQVADGATSQGFLNYVRTNDNTGKFTFTSRTGSSEYKELLWINGATSNWTLQLTGNSPYGMQITTTSDGSSSHDAFVIKRASNTKVFEVFNNGILKIYGNIIPQTDNAYDLGSSSLGWRNIYTNDLNLSNMKSDGNDVDGTKGSWTIQEGKDDLFLINRTNGKKYKFKLEMV